MRLLHSLLLSPLFLSPLSFAWPANWNMSESTYLYACTSASPLSPAQVKGWFTVNLDWSTNKAAWARAKPMTAEESLIANARALAAAGHRVMLYRNVAKSLPFFSTVAAKLSSPDHAPWFMPFGPNKTVNGSAYHTPTCDTNYAPPLCSNLYHDLLQCPGYPGGDGACSAPACDVGGRVPVGEYLFNPLAWNVSVNGTTLRDWFVEEYIFGPTGLGDPVVQGSYFDDYWASPLGPSEMEAHAVLDMNLAPPQVAALAAAWASNMRDVYLAMADRGKVAEQEFFSPPRIWRTRACANVLRPLCGNASAPPQTGVSFFDLGTGIPPWQTALAVAEMLLARGPVALIGHKWGTCGCNCELPPPLPPLLQADYGEPLALCYEVGGNSGVFARNYTHADVSIDCNEGPNATIVMR